MPSVTRIHLKIRPLVFLAAVGACSLLPAQSYFWKDPANISATTLGHNGKYAAIPEDQSGVSCLAAGPGAVFYGGTQACRGKPAWLFEGDADKKDVYKAACLDKILPGQSIVTGLERDSAAGIMYGGTRNLRQGNWLPEFDYQEIYTDAERDENAKDIRPAAGRLFCFESLDKIMDLGAAQEGEGIFSFVLHPQTKTIYGITDYWKIFKYDRHTKSFKIIHDFFRSHSRHAKGDGKPQARPHPRSRFRFFGQQLIVDKTGKIWGSGNQGRLFTIDITNDSIVYQDIYLPVIRGREDINGVQSWVMAPEGTIYGGTGADGILFSFDPAAGLCRSLGKPNYAVGIPGLAMNRNGLLFIAAGNKDTKVHMAAYDTKEHYYIDFGIIRSLVPSADYHWRAYMIGPLLVHGKNVLVLGENDRAGHLFFYQTGGKLPRQFVPPPED